MKKLFILAILIVISTLRSTSQVTVTIGTGTIQNTSSDYPAPYGNWFWGAKHQFIIPASELYAAGIPGNTITALSFDVVTPQGTPLQNFEILMGHTTQSSLSTWVGGLTTVYNAASYTDVVGWNNHIFGTPFVWNGADNIVIETCFNNSSFTNNAVLNQSVTTYNSSIWNNADVSTVCSSPGFVNSDTQRPNMQLSILPNSNSNIDLGVTSFISPISACVLSANSIVSVNVVNFGNNDTSNINVSYSVDGGTPVTEIITDTIASHSSYIYTFSTTASLTGLSHTINAYTSLPQDTALSNDSTSITIVNQSIPIPYIENFDSLTDETFSSSWGNGWTGVGNNFFWQAQSGNADFNTGPDMDHTTMVANNGIYLHTDLSFNSGDSTMLVSPCFDLSGTTAPVFNFWYHKYGVDMGDLFIDVYSYTTNSWTRNVDQILGQTHTGFANVDPWTERTVGLTAFVGEVINIRLRAVSVGCCAGAMAIDDIRVWEPSPITANFTASDYNPEFLEAVNFTDLSNSSPNYWLWDFGGGNTSTLQNPSFAFNTSGTQTVTLISSNGGFFDTTSQTLTVQLPPAISVNPSSINVNIACGDSASRSFTIYNTATGNLNITGGVIGGGGIVDSSTITYTTTGETTTHNFSGLINGGIDTLFLWVNANGDYDNGAGSSENISDVLVDGNSLGSAANQSLTIGNWDSTLLFITGPLLNTVLADGMLTVDVVSGTGVNTGFLNALDQHHVRIFTNGEGWLEGTVPVVSIPTGDSLVIDVDFYSFGLFQGTYNSVITIASNDPGGTFSLPVSLTIAGTAEYILSDTCIDFDSVLQNATVRDTIEILNTGCDTLDITSAIMTNPDFSLISGPTSLLPGVIGLAIIEFTPSSIGAISGNLLVTTNVEDTTICLSGVGLPAPLVTATPNPMIVNLACGDSVIQDFYIHNSGLGTLDVTGGIIGGGGVADSSTIFYTTTGATTTHTFNISNTGIDTLFFWVNGNGDYDSGVGSNEFISDITVDGVSIGTAATQQLTLGTWDSTLLYITDPLLSTVLADGMITVVVQDGSGVNPGQGALDAHHVRVFTNGEGWLTGSVPVVSILPGDSTAVPVTFHSFGLFQGTYNSTIIIESNDPGSPFDLPVILNISGTAKIALSDSCIDFGNSVVSETLVDTLEITNTGCDTILISSVTSSNPAYTTSVSSTSILPGATSLVIINFTPITLGPISGNILIQSNLADTTICLDGVGLNIITDFVYGDQDPCTAEIVFKDTSRGSPISWFWDFGDGTTDTVFSPTHYFSVPNTYNVTLVTCNATGCDTITKQVIVGFALNEEIVSIGSFEVLTNVDFSVIGLDIILIQWNFGDDSPDDVGLTASHTYALPGEYIVTATVSNSSGCQFDIYDTITITAIGASIAEDLNDLISVYPNPVKDNINISSTIEMLNSRIELVNMLGETVYVGTANLGNNIFDISIDNFENGNYFLKITTDKGDYMSKKILLVK